MNVIFFMVEHGFVIYFNHTALRLTWTGYSNLLLLRDIYIPNERLAEYQNHHW